MRFSKRMDRFGEGIFSRLAEIKNQKLAKGEPVIDLSIGAPISRRPGDSGRAVRSGVPAGKITYTPFGTRSICCRQRRSGQNPVSGGTDPDTEICSLLGSQEGLSHIALSIIDGGDAVLVPDPSYPVSPTDRRWAGAELFYMPQKKRTGI